MPTVPDPTLAVAPHAEADAPAWPTVLITGSSGGIGLALAERLAGEGWRVLLHGRDPDKLGAARAALGGARPHDAFRADFADLDAVRRLAEHVREATGRLDVLVHNAGLLTPSYAEIPAGVETTMAVNALAPFVLTNALRPLLEATADAHEGARVVTVSSEAHRGGRFRTLTADTIRRPVAPDRYTSIQAYAQSKLVATTWTLELARRLDGTGVTANACHPGLVRTNVYGGFGRLLRPVLQALSFLYLSPEQGAESPYLLATAPRYGERTGRWITRSHLRGPHEATPPSLARSTEAGDAVWAALASLAS